MIETASEHGPAHHKVPPSGMGTIDLGYSDPAPGEHLGQLRVFYLELAIPEAAPKIEYR